MNLTFTLPSFVPTMHRLPRRSSSLSNILRLGVALRRATLSSASVAENDAKFRCYSSFLRSDTSSAQPNWKRGMFLLKRYQSTTAAADESSAVSGSASAQRFEYQPEVSRLMDLIVNGSNSYKDVFVRELISNASDDLNKLQVLSFTEPELLKDNVDFHILIKTDKDNGIITITDTGIGMTKKELVDCLGNIAQSGTAKFLKALKDGKDAGGDNKLIGQYGVGFFSAFLVSDRVVVSTKSPKSDKRYVWEGEANASSYTIYEEPNPEKPLPRGTHLTLYLKRDYKGFAHPERIEKLVRNYSQYVPFRVFFWKEEEYTLEGLAEAKTDKQDENTEKKKKTITVPMNYWDTTINEPEPIWLRYPSRVEREEYLEFYKNTFNEYLEPLASSSHSFSERLQKEKLKYDPENELVFKSTLYVPAIAPSRKDDIVNPKTKNIRLYVKRAFISDGFDGELFPRYLSFLKGMVESAKLPINVSREEFEASPIVRIMRAHLVRMAFDMIAGIAFNDDREVYEKFWENYGKHLKLGCIEDHENHKRIAPLLRFFSSKSEEELISLDEYVENMKPDQKDIYYVAADSVSSAKSSPYVEKLAEKDLEVLFLVEDPIDEVAIQNLKSYMELNFVDIGKEDLVLGDKNEETRKGEGSVEALEAEVVVNPLRLVVRSEKTV